MGHSSAHNLLCLSRSNLEPGGNPLDGHPPHFPPKESKRHPPCLPSFPPPVDHCHGDRRLAWTGSWRIEAKKAETKGPYFSIFSMRDMPSKKLLPLLLLLVVIFFVPSSFSFLKLFNVTSRKYSSVHSGAFFFPFSTQKQARPSKTAVSSSSCGNTNQSASNLITEKELALLREVLSRRTPCNLIIFGLTPQLLSAALPNAAAGGATVFLEDDPEQLQVPRTPLESVRVYKVSHSAAAGEAFEMLRRARADPSCMPSGSSGRTALRESACPLALKDLPDEVYSRKWDVVVVDGPRGDRPEAPGRMGTIYSAAVMARWAAGEGTAVDVIVHDVQRTVEKWYSWEYLCDENRVRSKGNLWHFRIQRQSGNSNRFCSETKIEII